MASIKEKIKATLFSNATLAVMWGLAFFADAALVAIGLVNKDVTGAVAAMLGAIAAALMIFSIFLRERADAEDEAEAETADDGEEDGETIVEELLAEDEAETARKLQTQAMCRLLEAQKAARQTRPMRPQRKRTENDHSLSKINAEKQSRQKDCSGRKAYLL